jgi:hypothetical protein
MVLRDPWDNIEQKQMVIFYVLIINNNNKKKHGWFCVIHGTI